MSVVWEIWENPEGDEGCTQPRNGITPVDVDDVQMLLKHTFEVEGGTIYDYEHVRRAFDYSKKWNHDEDEWPAGCKPLDSNPRRCE